MFETIIMDFAWTGLLLLTGAFLRAKITVIQKLYIPAAVAGGFLGLLLGPEVLGRVCPVTIRWSNEVHQYSTMLLAILFSVQFFGVRLERKMLKRASAVWMIAVTVISAQVLTAALVTRIFGLTEGFALLPQSGFFGGHGTPEVLGSIWDGMEYWDRQEICTLGSVFATVGLLFATVGGITLINFATRQNWLMSGQKLGILEAEERTGYIEKQNRSRFMEKVVTDQMMDPLAFHVALVLTMMLCSMGLLKVIYWCAEHISFMRIFKEVNEMVAALIVSLIFSRIAMRTRLGDICDNDSLKRVGGTALEFVVTLSIATTDLDVIRKFGMPIILVSVLGIGVTVLLCLGLSRLWIKTNWFEHGMLMMGAYTGVLATGLMLLRIADPGLQTDASTDVVAASPLWILTSQNFYLVVAPIMVVTGAGFRNVILISIAFLLGGLAIGHFLCSTESHNFV